MIRQEDREALVGQVAFLEDELEAQEGIASFVPATLWSAELPGGEPSLLELYGLLVALSERSYPGLLAAWAPGGPTAADSVDELALRDAEPWNALEPRNLIRRARIARAAVVSGLRAVADWSAVRRIDGRDATLADLAYRITQEDAAILRRIGERLHEADLGGSPVTRLDVRR